jgi:HPt (histidine-containing phosphotransfer) domain-containing protein
MTSSGSSAHLHDRLAELGLRYLRRTAGEVRQLRTCVVQAQAGNAEEWTTIAQIAHRIRGSGGMFGFDLVSEAASDIEVAVSDVTTIDADYLLQLVDALDAQVQSASLAAGITK